MNLISTLKDFLLLLHRLPINTSPATIYLYGYQLTLTNSHQPIGSFQLGHMTYSISNATPTHGLPHQLINQYQVPHQLN